MVQRRSLGVFGRLRVFNRGVCQEKVPKEWLGAEIAGPRSRATSPVSVAAPLGSRRTAGIGQVQRNIGGRLHAALLERKMLNAADDEAASSTIVELVLHGITKTASESGLNSAKGGCDIGD
jgi:hypothetical protein